MHRGDAREVQGILKCGIPVVGGDSAELVHSGKDGSTFSHSHRAETRYKERIYEGGL